MEQKFPFGTFHSGKTGLPFQTFGCFQKFSTRTTKKVEFHLVSDQVVQRLLVHGKQPRIWRPTQKSNSGPAMEKAAHQPTARILAPAFKLMHVWLVSNFTNTILTFWTWEQTSLWIWWCIEGSSRSQVKQWTSMYFSGSGWSRKYTRVITKRLRQIKWTVD